MEIAFPFGKVLVQSVVIVVLCPRIICIRVSSRFNGVENLFNLIKSACFRSVKIVFVLICFRRTFIATKLNFLRHHYALKERF